MRILLTADPELPVPPPLYGGIERIIDWLARELVAAGHDVGLVAHRESAVTGVQLLPWPGTQSRDAMDTARNAWQLSRAVAAFRPDVVHSFSRLMYLAGLATSRVPRIMSFQRLPTARTVRWSSRIAGRRLVYTGCSEWICRVGRQAAGTWQAIHNGVELHRYQYAPSVPADAPLVFLSRLDRVKAPHLAIRAARAANHPLVIAGNFAERGPDRDYYEQEVKPHIDGDLIRYIGPVNDEQKNALLGGALAMLVPIQWDEPFGIVFAESLACGTPVISSPRGALPEIIREGVEGFLPSDEADLVRAIREVRGIDRAACRRRVEEAFSSSHLTGQYINLYESMTAGRLPA